MPKEIMTPRERWLAVLERQKSDRVPMDYWGTEEATKKLINYLKCNTEEELFKRLHIDRVIKVEPRYTGPPLPKDTDIFGCLFQSLGGGSEPFLTYKNMRGQEQGFIDLILNTKVVHFCLDKLFDICYENTLRIYETIPGEVMLTYVAEDLGSQEDLMYSPEQIHQFFIPRMKRMMDLAHQAGAFVFYHSDGAIRKIIPEMINAGMDVLNPVQWKCAGMEREGLKHDFGDKVIFHGGMDNQYTLAFGSKEEVREEAIDNLRILGNGGGYIIAPCHNIQTVSPPENIATMYDTGYEYGWN